VAASRCRRAPVGLPGAAALLLMVLACAAQAADPAIAEDEHLLASTEVMPAFAALGGEAAGGSGARREVVGLYINGREQAAGLTVLLPSGMRRLLPLRELAPLLGLPAPLIARDALRLQTPLGEATFSFDEIDRRADEYFVAIELLAQRLAAQIVFDDAEYAISMRLQWDPRSRAGLQAQQPIPPDTLAPAAGVSRVRGELLWRQDDRTAQESGFLEAFGRLGLGSWQGRYRREASGAERLQDYHWQTRRGDWAALVGHQVIGTHPLLSGFDLTGVQFAWSDRPDRLLAPLHPGRLVADSAGPIRSFSGDGPPGGAAELIIDGIARVRLRIPLDGRFEFRDVPVPAGYSRIEVALYAPFALGTPEQVLDFSGRASDRLLPTGASLVYGGVGQQGNPLDDLIGTGGSAGFVSLRHGISAGLSMDVATQRSDIGSQSALGATVDLRALGVATLGVARGNGVSASLLGLEGDRGRAFWRLSVREQEAGLSPGLDVDVRDAYAETGWRHWPRWEVSLIGREREGVGERVAYVKPAMRFRPFGGLVLQSRPDDLGDYVHDLSWLVRRDTRLSARQDRSVNQLGLDHRWSSQWYTAVATTESRDSGRRRGSVLTSWQSSDVDGWYVDAGVLSGEGSTGFLLRGGRELRPGVRLRVEARRDPLFETAAVRQGTVAMAALSFDLGRAGEGFTRAGSARAGTGGVGGRIVGEGEGLPLAGIAIRIDGQARARTDEAGRFNLLDVAPGVHKVELDEEQLPLELSPEATAYFVEVAQGATTSVEFRVVLRLGAAGQLRWSADDAARDGEVLVLDAQDRVRTRATVSRFGYYRVDGLPPGDYRLRWQDAAGAVRAELPLTLVDRFLFGQDLTADRQAGVSSDGQGPREDIDEQRN
jgi:hypothetical protein